MRGAGVVWQEGDVGAPGWCRKAEAAGAELGEDLSVC